MYYGRALLSGRQKTMYGFLGAGIVLFLAYEPKIIEAFFLFAFGGVVPGTSIILSPDVVMWSMVACVIAMLSVVCVRMFLRTMRNHYNVHIPVKVIKTTSIEVKEYSDDEPVERPVLMHPSRTHQRPALRIRLASALRTIFLVIRRFAVYVHRLNKIFAGFITFIVKGSLRLVTTIFSGIFWFVAAIFNDVWTILRIIVRGTMLVMRTVLSEIKPLMSRADEQLEVTARNIEKFIARKVINYEIFSLALTIGTESKLIAKDLAPKALKDGSSKRSISIKK